MESQIRTLTSNLHKCEDALEAQQSENENLKVKASRLEGSRMDGLTLTQLVELENILPTLFISLYFIIYYSSFIIHHSSFIIHHSSFIIHHSSFIIHHSSFIYLFFFFFFFFFDSILHMHHEGLRRVSQLRQEHMQKELEVLRKEKEALQEKQMCIVSFYLKFIFLFLAHSSFFDSKQICTEKPCNCVLLPCRHSSMCSSCCSLLTRCPVSSHSPSLHLPSPPSPLPLLSPRHSPLPSPSSPPLSPPLPSPSPPLPPSPPSLLFFNFIVL